MPGPTRDEFRKAWASLGFTGDPFDSSGNLTDSARDTWARSEATRRAVTPPPAPQVPQAPSGPLTFGGQFTMPGAGELTTAGGRPTRPYATPLDTPNWSQRFGDLATGAASLASLTVPRMILPDIVAAPPAPKPPSTGGQFALEPPPAGPQYPAGLSGGTFKRTAPGPITDSFEDYLTLRDSPWTSPQAHITGYNPLGWKYGPLIGSLLHQAYPDVKVSALQDLSKGMLAWEESIKPAYAWAAMGAPFPAVPSIGPVSARDVEGTALLSRDPNTGEIAPQRAKVTGMGGTVLAALRDLFEEPYAKEIYEELVAEKAKRSDSWGPQWNAAEMQAAYNEALRTGDITTAEDFQIAIIFDPLNIFLEPAMLKLAGSSLRGTLKAIPKGALLAEAKLGKFAAKTVPEAWKPAGRSRIDIPKTPIFPDPPVARDIFGRPKRPPPSTRPYFERDLPKMTDPAVVTQPGPTLPPGPAISKVGVLPTGLDPWEGQIAAPATRAVPGPELAPGPRAVDTSVWAGFPTQAGRSVIPVRYTPGEVARLRKVSEDMGENFPLPGISGTSSGDLAYYPKYPTSEAAVGKPLNSLEPHPVPAIESVRLNAVGRSAGNFSKWFKGIYGRFPEPHETPVFEFIDQPVPGRQALYQDLPEWPEEALRRPIWTPDMSPSGAKSDWGDLLRQDPSGERLGFPEGTIRGIEPKEFPWRKATLQGLTEERAGPAFVAPEDRILAQTRLEARNSALIHAEAMRHMAEEPQRIQSIPVIERLVRGYADQLSPEDLAQIGMDRGVVDSALKTMSDKFRAFRAVPAGRRKALNEKRASLWDEATRPIIGLTDEMTARASGDVSRLDVTPTGQIPLFLKRGAVGADAAPVRKVMPTPGPDDLLQPERLQEFLERNRSVARVRETVENKFPTEIPDESLRFGHDIVSDMVRSARRAIGPGEWSTMDDIHRAGLDEALALNALRMWQETDGFLRSWGGVAPGFSSPESLQLETIARSFTEDILNLPRFRRGQALPPGEAPGPVAGYVSRDLFPEMTREEVFDKGIDFERGRKVLTDAIQREEGLDEEGLYYAQRFIDSLPDAYLENLGIDFHNTVTPAAMRRTGGTEGLPEGEYLYNSGLVNIYRDVSRGSVYPERTIIHEISHHLEQFVPQEDVQRLLDQFNREMVEKGTAAIKKAGALKARADEQGRWLTDAEAKIAGDAYKYQNFNEWFAEFMTEKTLRDMRAGNPLRGLLQRMLGDMKKFATSVRNIMLGRGYHSDHTEAVYRNLVSGRYSPAERRPHHITLYDDSSAVHRLLSTGKASEEAVTKAPILSGERVARKKPVRKDVRYIRGLADREKSIGALNGKSSWDWLLDRAEEGWDKGGYDFYHMEPLRQRLIKEHGEEKANTLFREFAHFMGATSTGANVKANMKMASWFRTVLPWEVLSPTGKMASRAELEEAGKYTDLVSAIIDWSEKKAAKPYPIIPKEGYGHIKTVNHITNIASWFKGSWNDPTNIRNPKVRAFIDSLLGDQHAVAIDTHFMRLMGMSSENITPWLDAKKVISDRNLTRLWDRRKPSGAWKYGLRGKKLNPFLSTGKPYTGKNGVEKVDTYFDAKKAVESGVVDPEDLRWINSVYRDGPEDVEYGLLEEFANELTAEFTRRTGKPAKAHQVQASLWMGGADLTGVKMESRQTIMEIMRDHIAATAKKNRVPEARVLHEFVNNRGMFSILVALLAPTLAELVSPTGEETEEGIGPESLGPEMLPMGPPLGGIGKAFDQAVAAAVRKLFGKDRMEPFFSMTSRHELNALADAVPIVSKQHPWQVRQTQGRLAEKVAYLVADEDVAPEGALFHKAGTKIGLDKSAAYKYIEKYTGRARESVEPVIEAARAELVAEAGLPVPRDFTFDPISAYTREAQTPLGRIMRETLPGEAVERGLLVRFEGAMNALDNEARVYLDVANDRMVAQGLGKIYRGKWIPTETGVARTPKGAEVRHEVDGEALPRLKSKVATLDELYNALHNRSQVYDPVTNPRGTIRVPRAWREEFRILADEWDLVDAQYKEIDPRKFNVKKEASEMIEDYVYRGWKPPEDYARAERFRGPEAAGSKLLGLESFRKHRSDQPYYALRKLGFEPTVWNPHEMLNIRRLQASREKLQLELVKGLHLRVGGKSPPAMRLGRHDKIVADGNRSVVHIMGEDGKSIVEVHHGYRIPRVGPSFEGKRFVTKEGLPGITGQVVLRNGMADAMENVFGRKPKVVVPLPRGYKIDVLPYIRWSVYVPKKIKLFASIFQQRDFLQRQFSGTFTGVADDMWAATDATLHGRMGEAGRRTRDAAVKMRKLAWEKNSGPAFVRILKANVSPKHRAFVRDWYNSTDPIIASHPGITPRGLLDAGLSTIDVTIFPKDYQNLTRSVFVSNKSRLRKALDPKTYAKLPRLVGDLESAMRRGLFEGIYPSAMREDIIMNMVPMFVKMYAGYTDQQIMGLIARTANIRYSTIPAGQSVIQKPWLRELLTSLFFSLGEQEGLLRGFTKGLPLRGPEAKYWRRNYVGTWLSMVLTAEVIHFASTGEHLPVKRLNPIEWLPDWEFDQKEFWSILKEQPFPVRYNNRFARPEVPLYDRSGEMRLSMDLMGQMDTPIKMLSPSAWLMSRLNVPISGFLHQTTGKDFFDRWINTVGPTILGVDGAVSRTAQLMQDLGVPIGGGQSLVQAARHIPGEIYREDDPATGEERPITLKEIIPEQEGRKGLWGHVAAAFGFQLSASTNEEVRNEMTKKVAEGFPSEGIPLGATFESLNRAEQNLVNSHPVNENLRAEMARRGAEWEEQAPGDKKHKFLIDNRDRQRAFAEELNDLVKEMNDYGYDFAWFHAKVSDKERAKGILSRNAMAAAQSDKDLGIDFLDRPLPEGAGVDLVLEADYAKLLWRDDPETYAKYFPGEKLVPLQGDEAHDGFNRYEYQRRHDALDDAAEAAGLGRDWTEKNKAAIMEASRIKYGIPPEQVRRKAMIDYIAEHYWRAITERGLLNQITSGDERWTDQQVRDAWEKYVTMPLEDREQYDKGRGPDLAGKENVQNIADLISTRHHFGEKARNYTFADFYDSSFIAARREALREEDPGMPGLGTLKEMLKELGMIKKEEAQGLSDLSPTGAGRAALSGR